MQLEIAEREHGSCLLDTEQDPGQQREIAGERDPNTHAAEVAAGFRRKSLGARERCPARFDEILEHGLDIGRRDGIARTREKKARLAVPVAQLFDLFTQAREVARSLAITTERLPSIFQLQG